MAHMINRVIVLVVDGLGVGALPDGSEYGDAGCHTLAHLADAVGGLCLPSMEALGLGHLAAINGVRAMGQPEGCFGRLGFQSKGKDSLAGYWETGGLIVDEPTTVHRDGLPPEIVALLEQSLGRKILGNRMAWGPAIVQEHGAEHLSSGAAIVWTDGAGAYHIAAHEAVVRPGDLYRLCRDVRKQLRGPSPLTRVVAHPFRGDAGAFLFSEERRDMAAEPPGPTLLDALSRAGQIIMGVGKVGDMFSGRGLTRAIPAPKPWAAFDETVAMLSKVPRGLLYVSLDLWQADVESSASQLQDFDRRLPGLAERLRPGDLLFLTGDHGYDPARTPQTHSREYVPVLATGPKLAQGVNLGTRTTAADLGQTIAEALRAERLPVGESFLQALRPG